MLVAIWFRRVAISDYTLRQLTRCHSRWADLPFNLRLSNSLERVSHHNGSANFTTKVEGHRECERLMTKPMVLTTGFPSRSCVCFGVHIVLLCPSVSSAVRN